MEMNRFLIFFSFFFFLSSFLISFQKALLFFANMGASLDFVSKYGTTPFQEAVKHKKDKTGLLLLQLGVPVVGIDEKELSLELAGKRGGRGRRERERGKGDLIF